MDERDDTRSSTADIIGFIGLALAVLGLVNVALPYRIVCLAGASICLPLSFHRQKAWSGWVRWSLSIASDLFLGYVAWVVIRGR